MGTPLQPWRTAAASPRRLSPAPAMPHPPFPALEPRRRAPGHGRVIGFGGGPRRTAWSVRRPASAPLLGRPRARCCAGRPAAFTRGARAGGGRPAVGWGSSRGRTPAAWAGPRGEGRRPQPWRGPGFHPDASSPAGRCDNLRAPRRLSAAGAGGLAEGGGDRFRASLPRMAAARSRAMRWALLMLLILLQDEIFGLTSLSRPSPCQMRPPTPG